IVMGSAMHCVGTRATPETSGHTSALTGLNGLGFNGLGFNGLGFNGLGADHMDQSNFGDYGLGDDGLDSFPNLVNWMDCQGLALPRRHNVADCESEARRDLFKYAFKCAARPDQSFTFTDHDGSHRVDGWWSLAQQWRRPEGARTEHQSYPGQYLGED